jgi:hypothetical protein
MYCTHGAGKSSVTTCTVKEKRRKEKKERRKEEEKKKVRARYKNKKEIFLENSNNISIFV